MKRHLFYVLMDRTSPIHECEKCLNTNAKSVFQPNSVRSEGSPPRSPVLQEIIYLSLRTTKTQKPQWFLGFLYAQRYPVPCCSPPAQYHILSISDQTDGSIPEAHCHIVSMKRFRYINFPSTFVQLVQFCFLKQLFTWATVAFSNLL